MKKLLFVIDSLIIGGAEKSLVSLLSMIDRSIYEIDLLLFKQGEDFERYIPEHVNVLSVPHYFAFLNGENSTSIQKVIFLTNRVKTSLNLRINNYKKNLLHSEQVVYKSIQHLLQPLKKDYDVAIAYSQGLPTYFVANKVSARKKLAWINTDYVNTLYNKDFDFQAYKKINKIISVSEHTRDSISKLREEYTNKVDLILDIVNPNMITKMSEEYSIKEFSQSYINILTVGRLVSAKAYDKAIEAALLLKDRGYKFRWYAIGEGPERESLKSKIEGYDLKGNFILLGKKLNPYPYMKACDLYVQTSLKEGFGLTVCEAKILKRPIVCTNFSTAKEIIQHNVDGLIVNHDTNSIFEGIKKYIEDFQFKDNICRKLASIEPYSSLNQIDKFYQLIEI